MRMILCFCLFVIVFSVNAQTATKRNDPEFDSGFIMHARIHNGMLTNFGKGNDLYLGGIQVVPQYTLIPHKLRAGVIVGTFYTANKLQVLAGPTASFKLKTLYAGMFGSAANINIALDHLWGSEKQRLFGGGLYLDLLNRVVIGLSAHRDYKLNSWWLQQSLGIRISKIKKIKEPFN